MTYSAHDLARRATEPPKSAYLDDPQQRSEFARDRARILHSSALRRLADKTQVVVPLEDDFPRTRLTHSLEVAQIAREIGAALGIDPEIADAAGLAHDLGHPPFGHNGEMALDAMCADAGGFEGNAQTFRVITRLETKIVDEHLDAGLNLTRATLDATCKYPWPRQLNNPKFGVYSDDSEAFGWVRDGAIGHQRCMEAQVMDWADDVAYSLHDVEDGVMTGHLDMSEVAEDADRVCQVAAELYIDAAAAQLLPILRALLEVPVIRAVAAHHRDAGRTRSGRVSLKRMTSDLLGRFSAAAVVSTRRIHGLGPLSRYSADLVVPDLIRAECALLKACAYVYVMQRPGAAQLQLRQREILTNLVTVLQERPTVLQDQYADAYIAASNSTGRLRAVVDQVASLTDSSAMTWHRQLCDGRMT